MTVGSGGGGRSAGKLHGALSAAELAEGAVLASLALVLTFFGSFVPAGGVLIIAATAPYAALAYRTRLRATSLAAAASGAVLTIVLGPTGFVQQLVLAAFGYVVGSGFRVGAGRGRTATLTLAAVWLPLSTFAVAALALFGQLRELILEQILILGRSIARVLGWIGLDAVALRVEDAAEVLAGYWWIVVPSLLLLLTTVVSQAAHSLSYPALDRLRLAFGPPRPATPAPEDARPPAPVPARLDRVTLRYPDADHDALAGVDLEVEPGTFVVVCGDNGSGKSTLLRILAGSAAPTLGRVLRNGPVGLGRVGGTAIVFQRPETQVLGVHVGEDLHWGLDPASHVDEEALLAQVGLAGMSGRETAGLSGGELQRLAIASALARRPALLLSDECTAMLDSDGRRDVVALLRSIAADGRTVVHVTHHGAEAEGADLVVTLREGRVVAVGGT